MRFNFPEDAAFGPSMGSRACVPGVGCAAAPNWRGLGDPGAATGDPGASAGVPATGARAGPILPVGSQGPGPVLGRTLGTSPRVPLTDPRFPKKGRPSDRFPGLQDGSWNSRGRSRVPGILGMFLGSPGPVRVVSDVVLVHSVPTHLPTGSRDRSTQRMLRPRGSEVVGGQKPYTRNPQQFGDFGALVSW